MNGFLNYAARTHKNKRGAACGMASTCVALFVLALPALLYLAAKVGELFISIPSTTPLRYPTNLLLLILPTLAMIALPIMGMMLGATGIAMSKRDCQFAITGTIINLAALTAALMSLLHS